MDNIHTVVDKSGGLVDGLGTIGKMFVELGHTHQASLPPPSYEIITSSS